MKIQQFIDGAISADGGTISCRAVLDDGSILECGLDARIPKTKKQRLIFVGASYPTLPGARVLPRDCLEEQELIAAIRVFAEHNPSNESADMLLRGVSDR
jgi:hypothetical protein